jgi:hypothetical protein
MANPCALPPDEPGSSPRSASPAHDAPVAVVKQTQRQLIEAGIAALVAPGQVVEVRIPNAGKDRTVSGYYDDPNKLADCIQQWSGKPGVDAVYYTLNPVAPALLARAANRAKTRAQHTTTDKDVVRRAWLLIDVDPVRPAGISSSEPEKVLAHSMARAVCDYLESVGWPAPLVADSGNGYHLLYRIDLPNEEKSTALLRSCLEALAARFDSESVKIDTSVYNASRIVKAYGSLAAKGDSTTERPHRMSRILLVGSPQVVPKEQLEALAGAAPSHSAIAQSEVRASSELMTGGLIPPEKVEQFLQFHGVAHLPRTAWKDGFRWVLDECPFNPDHKRSAAVFLRSDGTRGFHCLHDSCNAKHWPEFREELERRSGGREFRLDGAFEEAGTVEQECPNYGLAPDDSLAAQNHPPLPETKEIPFEPFGLLGEVACCMSNSVPVEYLFADLITAFGCACKGHLYMDTGEEPAAARLYTVIVDDSSKGKSRSGRIVIRFFKDILNRPLSIGDFFVIDGAGSDRYLFRKLEEQRDVMMRLDELDGFMSKSRIEGSSLLQAVTTLFSETEFHSGTKTDEIDINEGRLSLRAGCTSQTFDTVASGAAMRLGFLNRLWIIKAGPFPLLGTRDEEKLNRLRERVLDVIPSKETTIPFTPDAAEIFESWRSSLPLSEATRRLDEIAYRIIPILAVTSYRAVADRELVEYVIRLMLRQYEHRLTVFPVEGKNQTAMMENKIRRVMSRYGRLSLPELRNKTRATDEGEFCFSNALKNVISTGEVCLEGRQVLWIGQVEFTAEDAAIRRVAAEVRENGGITGERLHDLLPHHTKADRDKIATNAGLVRSMQAIPGVKRPVTRWIPKAKAA